MLSWEFGTGWGCPRAGSARAGPWPRKFGFLRVQDLCSDSCIRFLGGERPAYRKGFVIYLGTEVTTHWLLRWGSGAPGGASSGSSRTKGI